MNDYEFERAIWQRVLSGGQEAGPSQAQEVLQELREVSAAARCYARLACRLQGDCRTRLQGLAREKQRHEKQLKSVYYLLTGQCPRQDCTEDCTGPVCPLLRSRFEAEQRAAEAFRQASQCYGEFSGLYTRLACETARHGEVLRCVVQHLLG